MTVSQAPNARRCVGPGSVPPAATRTGMTSVFSAAVIPAVAAKPWP